MKSSQRQTQPICNNAKVDRYFNDVDQQEQRMPRMESENSIEPVIVYIIIERYENQSQHDKSSKIMS